MIGILKIYFINFMINYNDFIKYSDRVVNHNEHPGWNIFGIII